MSSKDAWNPGLWAAAGGRVPDGWRLMPFGELLESPKAMSVGVMYPGDDCHSGVPLIRVGDVQSGGVVGSPTMRISQEVHAEYIRTELNGTELLITLVGKPGACVIARPHMKGWNVARALAVARLKEPLLRPLLKATFEGPVMKSIVSGMLNTTVQPTLNLKEIRALPIPIPESLAVSVAVGEIAEMFDDQLATLRDTNSTLEAIAQAIFKSWFIDFDPVKAKSEGRTPDGIDAETAALFPDSFEESALGAIPKGWTATPLRDVLTPIAERVGDSVVPEYASTNDGLVPREKLFNKQLSKSQANNKVIRRGDLVFGLSRATLNYGQMTDEIGSVSSAYKVFRVDSGKVVPVLLGRLISTRKEYFFNAVSASSREGQSVSTSSLERLQFACPPLSLQRALHSTLEPFLELIDCNLQEMATLAELRDTLLPRLISGKLKLTELQEVAEAL